VFFTKGVGHGNSEIISFENALRDAQIACYNLVNVSSIIPPGCIEVPTEEGIQFLSPGQIVYTVLSRKTQKTVNTNIQNIYASIGVAQPSQTDFYGYIGEMNGIDSEVEIINKSSQEQAIELLKTSRELDDSIDIKSFAFTAQSSLSSTKKYTTCVAAAVFIE
jgi:arginine decarboxylase